MKRDEKGRFAKKEEEGLEIMIGLPPLKRMLTWIFIIGVMMPWISIIRKNNLFQKLMDILDCFFEKTIEEAAAQKKWFILLIQILVLFNTNDYEN